MVAAPIVMNLETGYDCAYCGKGIRILEEVMCIEVTLPAKVQDVEYYVLEDEEGEYAYDPYFFHLNCWEEGLENDLNDRIEDREPIMCEGGIVECDGCTSDILPWEATGKLSVGEFRKPERSQDNDFAPRFIEYENVKPRAFCVSCLHTINSEILEMWEQDITHRGACEEGVHCRCWRYESCDDPGQPGCRLFDEVDG